MKDTLVWLRQLKLSYQQERQPKKLFGLIYLTPAQRFAILKEIVYPFAEENSGH